jgi:hypothetical protein
VLKQFVAAQRDEIARLKGLKGRQFAHKFNNPMLPARHVADRTDQRAAACQDRIVLARVGASEKFSATRYGALKAA